VSGIEIFDSSAMEGIEIWGILMLFTPRILPTPFTAFSTVVSILFSAAETSLRISVEILESVEFRKLVASSAALRTASRLPSIASVKRQMYVSMQLFGCRQSGCTFVSVDHIDH